MMFSLQCWQLMKNSRFRAGTQPQPRTPGLTRKLVRAHALRIFRDVLPNRPLRPQEWLLAEADLRRRLENLGW